MEDEHSLAPDERVPLNLLRYFAEATPEAKCLTFRDRTATFGELLADSTVLANALRAEGIGQGDRVAIIAPSSPIFYELLFACSMIGAIMMPLNFRLSSREIAAIIADGDPKLLLLDPHMENLVDQVASQPRTILLGDALYAWLDLVTASACGDAPAADDPILLLYTSGTTGRAKGVIITQRNLLAVHRTADQAWGFGPDSVNLVAMPLFHIGGIGYGMMGLSRGGQSVLLDTMDPPEVIAAMVHHRVSHAFFVPAVIQRLVDHVELEGAAVRSLERMIYGASPISENLLRRAIAAFDCGFNHAYGMTETSGTVITLAPHEHVVTGADNGRLRSCGQPLPWVDVALVDPENGKPVTTGEVGEIRVKGDMITPGYWNKPEETAEAIMAEGWLCTGDAAWQDEDGFFYIHDRYKDMIISGGENVYPAEIENVLAEHPAVAEVAVIGIDHEKWGETPCAYIVEKPGQKAEASQVIAFARERLAHFKCPTSVRTIDQLPRNASGKVLKHVLRNSAAAEGGR